MQEKIAEIAARMRELRELSGIASSDMARRLGLSVEEFDEFERGRDDIPASVLHAVAHELNVDMATLLTGDTPHMQIYSVTRKDQAVSVERRGDQYRYQSLAANLLHKKAEPFLVTVEPRPAGAPLHKNTHQGQEFDYVLEGVLKIYIHHHEIELGPGDSIFFDSGHDHAMEAAGGAPAKFLAIVM